MFALYSFMSLFVVTKSNQKRLNEINSRRLVPRLCSNSISFQRSFHLMLRKLLAKYFDHFYSL